MSDAVRLASVTLDCTDTAQLATFYAAITDGTITNLDEHWATVICRTGRMDFQRVANFVAPTWPDPTSPIQMHLEFHVDDRAAAEERVLLAGATKYEFQPNREQCFVYADPAGHPFCLTTWHDMRARTSGSVD
jgi:catechol-2,3-dioxygenase